jgi:hypothetical protein
VVLPAGRYSSSSSSSTYQGRTATARTCVKSATEDTRVCQGGSCDHTSCASACWKHGQRGARYEVSQTTDRADSGKLERWKHKA